MKNSHNIPIEQMKKLHALWSQAISRNKEVKRRKISEEEEAVLMNRLVNLNLPQLIVNQMLKDIRIYPYYDALAMWINPTGVMAQQEPDKMLKLGECFLIRQA